MAKYFGFLKKAHNAALQKAKETGENQRSDVIGPLRCQAPKEECSMDFVDEITTPDGEDPLYATPYLVKEKAQVLGFLTGLSCSLIFFS